MSQHVDADGIPYRVVKAAETRGRRLYLDGEPFPFATSGDYDLKVVRAHGLTVVFIPVVVDGPVTVTPKLLSARNSADLTDRVGEQATPLRVRSPAVSDL